jgi:hypothetical protein
MTPAQRRRAWVVIDGGKKPEPFDIFFNPFLWWWWLK